VEQFALLEKAIADWITLNVTIYVLIGVGLFLTVRSLFVQVRLFPEMIRTVLGSRKGADGGISSFQAFAISLAARVGIGNVFGVAAALLMGGPGAIFWMWVVALVGMGTAFFEATLAQIFKVKHSDGSFRGGPAYYMKRGMKNRVLANIFAVITVVTCGIVITSVQSNAIAGTLTSAFGEAAKQPLQGAGGFSAAQLTIAGLIFVFSAMVIFGGVRTVARVTEWMAPIMATIYVIMVAIICLMNLSQFGTVLGQIFTSAFSAQANVGGLGGGIVAAMINGTKRGLFSNEAGMGTSPHAHAMAEVKDPAMQGFVAMSGVFITLLICTSTALVILLTGVHKQPGLESTAITQEAFDMVFGKAGIIFLQVSIFFFAFTTIIGNYIFGEMNVRSLFGKVGVYIFRAVVIGSVFVGAIFAVTFVWEITDTVTGLMVIPNIIALIFLAPQTKAAYKNFLKKRSAGELD